MRSRPASRPQRRHSWAELAAPTDRQQPAESPRPRTLSPSARPDELGHRGAACRAARHRRNRPNAGSPAAADRFAGGNLAAILAYQACAAEGDPSRVGKQSALAQGTNGWARQGGTEAAR
jgi:hypothetical protein